MKEIIEKVKKMLLANITHAIPHYDDWDDHGPLGRCARFRDTGMGIDEFEDKECTCEYDERVEEVLAIINELEDAATKLPR